MNDIELMKMFHSFYDLTGIDCYLCLRKSSSFSKNFVELATRGILNNDINSFLIKEESIKLKNIFMFEMTMYLELSMNLIDNIFFFNLLFG